MKPDAASVSAGLVFMGIGIVYLLASNGQHGGTGQWAGSLLVLGLGVSWLVGVLTRRRR